jgi:hypothetical protein
MSLVASSDTLFSDKQTADVMYKLSWPNMKLSVDVSMNQEQMKTLDKDIRIVGRDLNWGLLIANWDR